MLVENHKESTIVDLEIELVRSQDTKWYSKN